MGNLAVYIHWPFCKSKCPYCDFNSHVSDAFSHERMRDAYLREIDHFSDYLSDKNITSIFFGGGTPSLMSPFVVDDIIAHVGRRARISNDCEITLEANPTSVEAGKFADFRAAGVNRVSLGVQALNADDLQFLGREHSAGEALDAVALAANVFENYTFDLIYARPGQSLSAWEIELCEALRHVKNHMSLYQLTIEKGTPFYSAYNKGGFKMPDDELAADFYELTNDIMEAHGLPAYEVSNHAADGFESKHNMTYWKYGDYLGIGAGAHSRISVDWNKRAMMMVHEPGKWLERVEASGNGLQSDVVLSGDEAFEEMVMMGLRIDDGVVFDERLKNVDELVEAGFVEVCDERLRATKAGRLVLNGVLEKLLG